MNGCHSYGMGGIELERKGPYMGVVGSDIRRRDE